MTTPGSDLRRLCSILWAQTITNECRHSTLVFLLESLGRMKEIRRVNLEILQIMNAKQRQNHVQTSAIYTSGTSQRLTCSSHCPLNHLALFVQFVLICTLNASLQQSSLSEAASLCSSFLPSNCISPFSVDILVNTQRIHWHVWRHCAILGQQCTVCEILRLFLLFHQLKNRSNAQDVEGVADRGDGCRWIFNAAVNKRCPRSCSRLLELCMLNLVWSQRASVRQGNQEVRGPLGAMTQGRRRIGWVKLTHM